MSITVFLGSQTVPDGAQLTLSDARQPLRLRAPMTAGIYYTLIIVDPDAPSPKNPIYKSWLHDLKVNITPPLPGGSSQNPTGINIMPYAPPSPPSGSGFHHYVIKWYQQAGPFSQDQITGFKSMFPSGDNSRSQFDEDDFASKNGLTPVAQSAFMTSA
jgi:hypothetical protein